MISDDGIIGIINEFEIDGINTNYYEKYSQLTGFALDDVNVYRFADYVKKFSDSIQFIIITHRKGTMEAADTVYGITMEEKGISKLVSMKLEE